MGDTDNIMSEIHEKPNAAAKRMCFSTEPIKSKPTFRKKMTNKTNPNFHFFFL